MSKQKSFTLIELLVVVAVIGLLISFIVVFMVPGKEKTRDANRMTSMRQFQKMLELYVTNEGSYPLSTEDYEISGQPWGSYWEGYGTLPQDPLSSQSYAYLSEDGSSFELFSKFEREPINPSFDCGGPCGPDDEYNAKLGSLSVGTGGGGGSTPATIIIRPNGAGDVTQLSPNPAVANYLNVDEAVPDEYDSYNDSYSPAYDLYNLDDHAAETGTINFVKVYVRALKLATYYGEGKIKIKTEGTEYDNGAELGLTLEFADYSYQWDENPKTGEFWTWDQIDDLQAGYWMVYEEGKTLGSSWCTQVYVEVNYNQ